MEVNYKRNGKRYQTHGRKYKMTRDWTYSDYMSKWVKKMTSKKNRRLNKARLAEEISDDCSIVYDEAMMEFIYHWYGIYKLFMETGALREMIDNGYIKNK